MGRSVFQQFCLPFLQFCPLNNKYLKASIMREYFFFYLIHRKITENTESPLPNFAPQKLAFPFTPLVFWYKYVLK
jgi:hypothetical protein